MFQLTEEDIENLRSQIAILKVKYSFSYFTLMPKSKIKENLTYYVGQI